MTKRRTRVRSRLAVATLVLATACGDDGGGAQDTDDTGGTAGDTDDGFTSAAQPDSADDSSGEVPLDPDGPRLGASGIVISTVTINQGVAVTLAEGGVALPNAARFVGVVHGRAALMRATWQLEPDFTPRPIRAELQLLHGDGTEEVLVDLRTLGAISGPAQSAFEWALPAASIPEGTQWRVTLHEDELAPDGLVDPDTPSLPAGAGFSLDDAPGEQRLRVMLIPYRHQRNGCDQAVESDEAAVEAFKQTMEMHYPVQEVEISVHPELIYTGPTADLTEFLYEVLDLRASEFPDPDVFYYGAIWPCETSSVGGLGVTLIDPSAIDAGAMRVSVGVHYEQSPDRIQSTMVHEVGHNLGRMHVACGMGEGNIDANYPIVGGEIGVEGWGIHDQGLRPPTAHDYMSYCDDTWVSPYGWSNTLFVIDQLRAQLGAGGAPAPEGGSATTALLVRDGVVEQARLWPSVAVQRADGWARWRHTHAADVAVRWQAEALGDSGAELVIVEAPLGQLGEAIALDIVRDDAPSFTVAPALLRQLR